jgi:hypothetical protein
MTIVETVGADLLRALSDVAAALGERDHTRAAEATVRLQTVCSTLARQQLDAETLRKAQDLLRQCQESASHEQQMLAASLLQSGRSNKAHLAYRKR